jgi:hypothetical protein
MVFLVKVSIVLLILLCFYKLVLERESFFTLNRYFLMGCLLAAFLLPSMTLPELINHQGVVTDLLENNSFSDLERTVYAPIESGAGNPAQQTDDPAVLGNSSSLTAGEPAGLGYWLALLYGFGVIVLSARLLLQVAVIVRTVLRAEDLVEDTDYTIVNVKDECGPRSFFKYIFLNPEQYKPETYEHILEHEKIHVRERHSLDLLNSEVAIIVLWFNPFIWKFKKEVEKNIENQTYPMMLDTPVV